MKKIRRGWGTAHLKVSGLLLTAVLLAACTSDQPAPWATNPDTGGDAAVAEAPPADEAPAADEGAPSDGAASQETTGDASSDATPAWQTLEMVNVQNGETFRFADFHGQVVILETMAVWCPLCDEQQRQIKAALSQLGDGVVAVSVDVDPGESADLLAAHAQQFGLDWPQVIAGNELARQLRDAYGPRILTPTATPVLLIGPDGRVYETPGGIKDFAYLTEQVNALR